MRWCGGAKQRLGVAGGVVVVAKGGSWWLLSNGAVVVVANDCIVVWACEQQRQQTTCIKPTHIQPTRIQPTCIPGSVPHSTLQTLIEPSVLAETSEATWQGTERGVVSDGMEWRGIGWIGWSGLSKGMQRVEYWLGQACGVTEKWGRLGRRGMRWSRAGRFGLVWAGIGWARTGGLRRADASAGNGGGGTGR